jgi:UDP-glucuronate decarboxylase
MKKILVTGGAGFIGSHLCEKLILTGHQVFCLDNFYTGNKKNIAHLLKNKNFKLIKHDIEKPIILKVDQIYNLACPASPVWYAKDPIKTVRTNVIGSINLLELAKKNNCPILQASTSEVYGDPEVHPQTENYWGKVNPIGLRACYDEGKRCAETLFFNYFRQYKVKIKVARIFNTYGPGMQNDDGRAVPNFINQALKNKDITIYGDGSQTRSFCFIDDMIDGLVVLMETENFTGPVNIGNPEEHTMKELVQKIIKLTSSKSKVVYKNLPPDDPARRRPDISLAKKKLKWQPKILTDEGLKKTIEYFKSL